MWRGSSSATEERGKSHVCRNRAQNEATGTRRTRPAPKTPSGARAPGTGHAGTRPRVSSGSHQHSGNDGAREKIKACASSAAKTASHRDGLPTARASGSAGWEPPPETRSETESHAQRRRAAPKGNSGRRTPRGPKRESRDPEAERPEGQVPGGASHSEAMRGRGGQKPEDRPRGPTSSEGRREARPQTSRSDVPCGQHEGDRRPRERGRHREDTRTTLPRPLPPR